MSFKAATLEYYRDHYGDGYTVERAYEDIEPGYRFTIHKIREATDLLGPDERRVLDIGCGLGYLLVEPHRRGFECLGIDFNERLVTLATERYGVPARVERIENLVTLGETFDLVILSHVLEHVEGPTDLLRNIHRILNPGGLLVIEVPNRNWRSIGYNLRRGTCGWDCYPPHHLTFWSDTALAHVLRRSGFDVLECRPRPFDDLNRVKTFLQNRMGLTSGPFLRPAVRAFTAVGRLCRLQGITLNALGRKTDTRS